MTTGVMDWRFTHAIEVHIISSRVGILFNARPISSRSFGFSVSVSCFFPPPHITLITSTFSFLLDWRIVLESMACSLVVVL